MGNPVALVLGASGQIGRFLVPRLLDAGWTVLAASRQPRVARHPGLKWLQGDLFSGLAPLPAVDAIFSLGPLDGFARWLASSHLHGTPQILALGSMSALSKRQSRDPHESLLAQSLLDAEAELESAARSRGLAWTILRCTLIYGAGIDRSLSPLARLATKYRIFPRLSFASGLRQPVHAGDLAEACLLAVGNTQVDGRILSVGGAERLPFSSMLDRVIDSLPMKVLRVPLNLAAMRLGMGLARPFLPGRIPGPAFLERLSAHLVADDETARELLGWSPRGFAPVASTWTPKALF